MDKPIRFALITYGKVARLHAKALRSIPGAQLVAVYGRDRAKREAFASEFGIQPYGDIAEMVAGSTADVVIVASPHPQHKDHAITALQAGAHVLVEKPMAILVEDCDEMMAAAIKAGRLLSVICQRRWYPSVQRIRKAIDAGKLGEPALGQVVMLGWRDQAYYASDPWRGSWEHEGGGVLVNQAPHQLDLLQWLMGPALEVSAYWENLNHPYVEVEDTAVASIRFAGGALGSVLVSNSQKPGIYAKVHIHGRNGASAGVQTDGGAMFIAGTSGVLEPPYNDIWTIPGEEKLLDRWKEEDTGFFGGIEATEYFHALQFADFAEAIRTGKPPAVGAEEGRATVALIQAIYRSGREKRPVQL
ncbi:MAG: Gfo/Idh/MocA family oxidoreductase [Spirochaetota bacterium]